MRAGLKCVCSLLQPSSPGIPERAPKASQTAVNSKEAATPAASVRTCQHSHEVANHTMINAFCTQNAHSASCGCLVVKKGHNLKAAPMSCHACCASVRSKHAAKAHGICAYHS